MQQKKYIYLSKPSLCFSSWLTSEPSLLGLLLKVLAGALAEGGGLMPPEWEQFRIHSRARRDTRNHPIQIPLFLRGKQTGPEMLRDFLIATQQASRRASSVCQGPNPALVPLQPEAGFSAFGVTRARELSGTLKNRGHPSQGLVVFIAPLEAEAVVVWVPSHCFRTWEGHMGRFVRPPSFSQALSPLRLSCHC